MSWEATSVPRSNREAWRWYSTVHARLMRQLARDLGRETGLSEADYQILDALLDMPGCRARALELRCTLQWEKSRLSRQLARMEDRGLLERTPCPVDARGMDIILTAAGREAAAQARQVREASVQALVFDTLEPEQIAGLMEATARLAKRLDQAERDDPACQAARAEIASERAALEGATGARCELAVEVDVAGDTLATEE